MIRSSAAGNTSWLPTGGLRRWACSSIQREKLNAAGAMAHSILTRRAERPANHLPQMRRHVERSGDREKQRQPVLRPLPTVRGKEPDRPDRRHAKPAGSAASHEADRIAKPLVPGAGLQPARPCGLGILSPLRLAISPPGQNRFTRYRNLEAGVGIEPA